MEKNILVTGAGGYIGCVLVQKLLEKGYSVRALDRFFFGVEKLKPHEQLTIIKDDARKMKEEYLQDIDAVIDLVAISNDPSGELFQDVTYEINYQSRVNTAKLAKKLQVKQYILPSSCSIYGFQDKNVIVNETYPTNPLTTYAKANEMAELEVLPLADDNFCVTVLRQATVFGVSPRMRFDLAINGITYGAWEKGVIPLMRDGTQYRPMVHVQDTTDVMCLLLETDKNKINGEIFNVGSNENNYQLKELADEISTILPKEIKIEWYGDPDHRSYRVDFSKIEKALSWKAKWKASDGALEIYNALEQGEITKSEDTITLNWYKKIIASYDLGKELELYNGILQIE